MNKKHLVDEARKLFVQELLSFLEIAKKIKISERTLRIWAKKENWELQREEVLNSAKSIYKDRVRIAKMLGKRIIEKLAKKEDVPASDMQSYRALTDGMDKVKKFEQAEQQQSFTHKPQIKEQTSQTIKEVFGYEQ